MAHLFINGSSCACSRRRACVCWVQWELWHPVQKSYLATRSHFSMHSEQKRCMQPDTSRQSFTMPASRASLLKPWHATATSRRVLVSAFGTVQCISSAKSLLYLTPARRVAGSEPANVCARGCARSWLEDGWQRVRHGKTCRRGSAHPDRLRSESQTQSPSGALVWSCRGHGERVSQVRAAWRGGWESSIHKCTTHAPRGSHV